MLKTIQSFAVIAVVLGLMSGCSTNKAVEEVAEPETTLDAGINDTGVDLVEVEDPLSGVATTFYFEFDSAVLNAAGRAALIAHAEFLRESSESARLEGHADERGSREYNMALGERRAFAVRDFLVVQGVNGSQLETVSYGEENPVQMGGTESSWSKNRRVELSYK